MRYGEGLLEEIRRRTDLVALVGRRVKLVRKGRVMWGCCPFHPEKSPSFKVENERRLYKCFGCGQGGDCFKWLMETEGLSFPESVEKLAGEAGVELPKWSPEDEARESRRKSLYDIVELAAAFYQEQLFGDAGKPARDYLKTRGLDGAAAKQFRLGYAPSGGNALIAHLTAHNVTQDDMIEAGLARPAQPSEDGRSARPMRDFFFDRLMFPIADGRGRVIAFGGRGLSPDAKPKYINSGETPLFSKGSQLYNFAAARAAAIKAGTIILAEGYMDVIALVRAGFTHAVAPLGTAFTEDQLQMLWKSAPEPVLAFDGDEAGQNAALKAAKMALPHLKAGHSLRFAFLPQKEDPDTLIAKFGAGAMSSIIERATGLLDLLWRSETEGKDFSAPERLAGLEQSLSELTRAINDPQIRKYYQEAFNEKVSAVFKAKPSIARRQGFRGNFPKGVPAVTSALKNNALVQFTATHLARRHTEEKGVVPLRRAAPPIKPATRALEGSAVKPDHRGMAAGRQAKENELAGLLWEQPQIAVLHAEIVAELPFTDPSLDMLRRELLNLAASGSSLEKAGVQTHFARLGMAEFVARMAPRTPLLDGERQEAGTAEDDPEARFLRAARDLRELAEGPSEQSAPLDAHN
ncbi:MAG TPA: DNA primase [Rhizomicrobium sp.]|nr:DNA primase [Rhizomicrobium sp.]